VNSDVTDPKDQTPVVATASSAGAHPDASQKAHADDHGSTPANWTANILIVLGFLVGTVGVVFGNRVLLVVGVALLPIGLIAGKLLSGMGYGKSSSPDPGGS
jgi:hypothetical protein